MQTVFTLFSTFLSLFTASGIFVHDVGIDRATVAFSTVKAAAQRGGKVGSNDLGNLLSGPDPHTHPEHGSRTLRGFTYKTPTHPPREQRIKKHMMQNVEPRGRHAFDNYHLPFLEHA